MSPAVLNILHQHYEVPPSSSSKYFDVLQILEYILIKEVNSIDSAKMY